MSQANRDVNAAQKPEVVIRAMGANDISAVLDIQSRCYDAAKRESARSFLAKLEASPASCFVALRSGRHTGYLVAVPAQAYRPPPLHGETYSLPAAPDSLYLHDLAVHPEARGSGVAPALVAAYFEHLRAGSFRFACLTAVNASGAFWARYGFRAAPDGEVGDMATYGEGAQYMRLELRGQA